MRDDETVTVAEPQVPATDTNTEVPAEVATTSTDEASATVEAAKAVVPDEKETPKAPEGPTAEEIQTALDAFQKTATAVAETRDSASGELAEAEISKVKLAYAALPVPGAKKKARDFLEESMRNALSVDLDAPKARSFMILGTEVKAAGGTRETIARTPVDPTEAHVERVTAMYLASSMVDTPEGVADDWVTKVQELAQSLTGDIQAYKAYLGTLAAWSANTAEDKGDEPSAPEVHPAVVNAAKIALGRGVGRTTKASKSSSGTSTPRVSAGPGYSGPRRNVKSHIQQVFEDKPVGTFLKVGEIANAHSDEYGDDHPSSGAITASLESNKFDVPGIQADTENGLKGARKVA